MPWGSQRVRRLAEEWADNWRYAVEADARDAGRPPPGPPVEPPEPRRFAARLLAVVTLATAGAGVWRGLAGAGSVTLEAVLARGWPYGAAVGGMGLASYAYDRWRWRRHQHRRTQPDPEA